MKHVVTITTSNPAHEHVSLRRRQSTTNFMVEARDEQEAVLRASAHFRRLGHYIHEAKIFKKKSRNDLVESETLNELRTPGSVAGRAVASKTVQSALTRIFPGYKPLPEVLPVPEVIPAPMPAPVRVRPSVPSFPKPIETPVHAPSVKVQPELEVSPALKQVNDEIASLEAAAKTRPLTSVELQRLYDVRQRARVQAQTRTATKTRARSRMTLPMMSYSSQRREGESHTLGQWRPDELRTNAGPMYNLYQPFRTENDPVMRYNFQEYQLPMNEQSYSPKKAMMKAVSRVLAARAGKQDTKEKTKEVINKINMEPKLMQNVGPGAKIQ
jgi:hypothetical protein